MKKNRPSRRILDGLTRGLQEIEAYFGWPVADATLENSEQPEEPEEVADEDGIGDEEPIGEADDDGYFEAEEIEVAVDSFLSYLHENGLIRKNKAGKLPTFYRVFEKFFGEDHEIAKLALTFEEKIEGYFGWISFESMGEARESFIEIFKLVRQVGDDSRGG